jgi:hypothetical protein
MDHYPSNGIYTIANYICINDFFLLKKRRSAITSIDTPSPIRHVTEPIKSGLEKLKREWLKLLSTVAEIPEVEIPLSIPNALIDHKFEKKQKKNKKQRIQTVGTDRYRLSKDTRHYHSPPSQSNSQ